MCGDGYGNDPGLTGSCETKQSKETVIDDYLSCKGCFKIFQSEGTFKKHVRNCKTDLYSPNSSKVIEKHMDDIILKQERVDFVTKELSGSKRFPCEVCGKIFGRNSHLRRHSNLHTREKVFKCTICTKEFTQQNNLKAHVQRHNKDKQDDKKVEFIDKVNLPTYKRTGDSIFQCKECGKKCKQRTDIVRHMAVHNPIKMFPCNVCGKRLSRKDKLIAHKKTMHLRK